MRRPLSLVWHQFRYDQRTFWRDPAAVFFTAVLPLIFLFLLVAIFGNETVDVDGREVKGSTYYVPAILGLGLVSATLVNLANTVTSLRERGTLKRVRSTPLPPWAFMAGRIGTALVVSVLLVVLVGAIGRLVFDVTLPTETLPGLVLTVLVGGAAFCSIGFALTALIPTENAAPAVTNAVVLPLYFISGVFVPSEQMPDSLQRVADLFPVKHLLQALFIAFDPAEPAPGIAGSDLAVIAVWGVVGLAVAVRTFRWTPTGR